MFGLENTWQLDPRLQADTFPITSHGEYLYLLMNDKRWPWIIIVPQVYGLEELHDLPPGRIGTAMQIAADAGKKLKAFTGCDKINIAAIGNIVRQVHIHVVARSEDDPNWPAPVWGFGEKQKYDGADGTALAAQLKEQLRVSLFS